MEVVSIICKVELGYPIDLDRLVQDYPAPLTSMDSSLFFERRVRLGPLKEFNDSMIFLIYDEGKVLLMGDKRMHMYERAAQYIQDKMKAYGKALTGKV